jgi:cellulose biosynthesis protein BcsQ
MKVLSVGAQKGGVGKTTTSLYLATRAAAYLDGTADNPAVGLVDRDESKNLTELLTDYPTLIRAGVVLLAGDDIPPASAGLQLIIIDTPPGLSAISSLEESDLVIMPVVPETQSVINLRKYLETIEHQRLSIEHRMRLLALLPTRVETRSPMDRLRLDDIRAIAAHQDPAVPVLTPVPQRASIKRYELDAPEYDQPARELFDHAKITRRPAAL